MSEIKYASQEFLSHYPQNPDLVDPPFATPVATASGSSSASVSFTPAVTGGIATSYKVTAYLVPNYIPTSIVATGAGSPITVTGLGPNATYRFKVQGVNASGVGPVSYASNPVGFGARSGDNDNNDKDGHVYYWDDKRDS